MVNIRGRGSLAIGFEPEKLPNVVICPTSDIASWSGDLLIVGCFEDSLDAAASPTKFKSQELQQLDQLFDGSLSDVAAAMGFKAKSGTVQKTRIGKNAKFIALCGMGPASKATVTNDWGLSIWQKLGNAASEAVKGTNLKTVGIAVADASLVADHVLAEAAGKVANGFLNGAYEATRFKNKPTISQIESVHILFPKIELETKTGVADGIALAQGALYARYLVEAPPNVATPSYLAEAAAHIVAIAPEVMKLKVLEKEECEELGMGCFLGVSEASAEPPKFIHLTYTPKSPVKKKIAIVGKGVCYDCGGINIKPSVGGMIELMKFDMAGSGATLGAARAIAALQPEGIEIHFIVAACENMVDGRCMRPGDVLMASNGTTVEITNTDAEGRLTLADALIYAQKLGVEAIVDIATLTGACIIGLGPGTGGMYASDDGMAAALSQASKATGEKIWRLPFDESYVAMNKSAIADLKNQPGQKGGSITAALFLREFVDTDKVSYGHLDMAGPCWNESLNIATGFGAQLLAVFAVEQGK